jgi:hypothetical protein
MKWISRAGWRTLKLGACWTFLTTWWLLANAETDGGWTAACQGARLALFVCATWMMAREWSALNRQLLRLRSRMAEAGVEPPRRI